MTAASVPAREAIASTVAERGQSHERLASARDGARQILPLFCDSLLGADAARSGLISLAVDDSDLGAKANEIATRLAEAAQSAIR